MASDTQQQKRGVNDLTDDELLVIASKEKRGHRWKMRKMRELLFQYNFRPGKDRVTTYGLLEWLLSMCPDLSSSSRAITRIMREMQDTKYHCRFHYYKFDRKAFKGKLYELYCSCTSCARGRGLKFYGSSREQEKEARYLENTRRKHGWTQTQAEERYKKYHEDLVIFKERREEKERQRKAKRKLSVERGILQRKKRNEENRLRKKKEREAKKSQISRVGDEVYVKSKT